MALSVGEIEVVAKTVFYFLHERMWNSIHYGKREVQPFVLWLTGLSGAGKSTLADRTAEALRKKGYKIQQLDGDTIRSVFPQTGFTKSDRDQHIRRVGFLASLLEKNGTIVISSFISPYRESRQFVREQCQRFVEAYVSAPLDVCESRDVKGLYKKARRGEIKNFTGIDDPYEPPENPEFTIPTHRQTVDESVRDLMALIEKKLL